MSKIRGNGVLVAALLVAVGLICPSDADAELFLSQVQITGGSGKADNDFVEIFNPTSEPVNLNSCRLVKRTAAASSDSTVYAWDSDVFVQPGGFYLWAQTNFLDLPLAADAQSDVSLSNDNGLALRLGAENSGQILDSLAWGSANNGFRKVTEKNPGANKALLRSDLFSASSTFADPFADSAPRNSFSAVVPLPDSGGDSTSTPPEDSGNASSTDDGSGTNFIKSDLVKISEIVPNPVGDDDGNEAVELQNLGSDSVDISGWYLDDASSNGIKSSAYQLPTSTVIAPSAYLVIIIPKGHFALNNTGDTVNLYFADKTLADSVSYSTSAGDGQGWQNVLGVWQWAPSTLGAINQAPPPAPSGGGGSSVGGNQNVVSVSYPDIELSEIMPNPEGSDEGQEWVEVYNPSAATTSLAGWILDDDASSTKSTSDSYTLPELAIGPNGFAVITIPAKKFSLSNSAADAVRLFYPNGSLKQRVGFVGAKEGQSFALGSDGQWSWSFATPGTPNNYLPPLANVIISEILPKPSSDEEEFVELYNASDTPADLTGFKLLIGQSTKVFTQATVAPFSYLVLYEDDLPAKLRNSGQSLSVVDNIGRILSQATYPAAAGGQAYAYSSGGYNWTDLPTPGSQNQIVLAASDVQPAKLEPAPTKVKKSVAASASANELKLEREIKNLELTVSELRRQQSLIPEVLPETVSPAAKDSAKGEQGIAYLSLSLSSLSLFGLLVTRRSKAKA